MKTVIKYLQLPFSFSAADMRAEVDAITAGWKLHYNERDYAGDWSAVPLRSVGGRMDNVVAHGQEMKFAETALLAQCPYMRQVIEAFECPLMAVRLLRLGAGSEIKEHTDAELNYEQGEARIHIPVQTHEDVAFFLDGERLAMREGECWYTNVNLPHRVMNDSGVDRIHLVLDCVVNEWMRDLFETNREYAALKEVEEKVMTEEQRLQMIASLREMGSAVALEMAEKMERGEVTLPTSPRGRR